MATSPNFRVPSKLHKTKLEAFNDRDADIFESGLAVRPENPHFVWRLRTQTINDMYIPMTVIDCYQLEIPNSISVVDGRGKEWDVKIFRTSVGRTVCSRTDWRRLCKANLVRTGDACICEFMPGHIGLYIRVHVIRANEFRSHDIFRSGLAVEPGNPCFVWRLTCLEKINKMCVPIKIAQCYNLKTGNSLTLVDERGNKWETYLVSKGTGYLGCSTTGWRKLCDANIIRIGDRCICEFIQESSGLAMHVRVVRPQAHILTRKKGVEEEAVEQVDEESTYENGYDENAEDGSWMQRNIVKGKHQLNLVPVRRSLRKRNTTSGMKGFEEENCAQTDNKIFCLNLPNHDGCDENDGDVSGMETNISKAKRKLRSPSSHAPVRRSARKHNAQAGWKTEDAQQREIENRDACIKKLKGIIKPSKYEHQKREMFSCRKDDSLQGTSIGSLNCLPEKLELLQSYFHLVGDQAIVLIDLHDDVFGKTYKICILPEIVEKFCLLEPIADPCIISYMWYLHRKMKTENLLHRFQFVNPNYISYKLTTEQRVRALADRLIGASSDQLVLAPCNVGFHWILTVIEPYKKTVYLLDPLSHRVRDESWRDVVNEALSMFSESKGDKQKLLSRWVVVKAHIQPDSKQCGFYIMRYMKQIIEACRGLGSISLQSMFTKERYSTSEIDEIRTEWAECVLDLIV